jgi:3',5'-cyclic-AMP phosphodiesterase
VPLAVPAEKLRSVLGIRSVSYVQGKEMLATIDQTLASS